MEQAINDPAFLELCTRDPKVFMSKVLGCDKLWKGQHEILEALATHDRISVASGHSLGKDYISARIIPWFLITNPGDCIVVATAPSDRQVENVIWGELRVAYEQAPYNLGGRLLNKKLVMDERMKWYAIGFTTKDVQRSPGKFQGFHARAVLVLFSEAQAIERTIWDQAESLMTAGKVKWLCIGNPLVNFGAFYETFRPGSGWKNIRLDCEENPNYLEGREVVPGLASRAWVEGMAAKHGRDSVVYKSKVKGLFPPRSEGAFISAEWYEWATSAAQDVIPAAGQTVIGVDIASGEGEAPDKTVIARRKGMRLTDLKKFEKATIPETVDNVVAEFNAGADLCYLDVGGLGIGAYQLLMLRPALKGKVIPVNFGGQPDDVEVDGVNFRDRYDSMASQIYHHVANLLEFRRAALIYDPDLAVGLTNRKMNRLPNGKLELESKKKYKARGYPSPDEADAVAMCYCNSTAFVPQVTPMAEVYEDEGGVGELFR